jgi:hypothetical protein
MAIPAVVKYGVHTEASAKIFYDCSLTGFLRLTAFAVKQIMPTKATK